VHLPPFNYASTALSVLPIGNTLIAIKSALGFLMLQLARPALTQRRAGPWACNARHSAGRSLDFGHGERERDITSVPATLVMEFCGSYTMMRTLHGISIWTAMALMDDVNKISHCLLKVGVCCCTRRNLHPWHPHPPVQDATK
jgi:hypothetical protein